MTTPDNHRVYSITDADRKDFVSKREQEGTTNETLLKVAVESKLDSLVTNLVELGFSGDTDEKRPIRLPISDETLAALRIASETTGLPSSALLTLVLRGYCGNGTTAKAKGKAASRKTAAPKASEAPRRASKAGKASPAAPKTRARKTAKKAAPKRTSKRGAK